MTSRTSAPSLTRKEIAERLKALGEHRHPYALAPELDAMWRQACLQGALLLSETERTYAQWGKDNFGVSSSAPNNAVPKLCEDCGCELECVKHGCAKTYRSYEDGLECAVKVCEREHNRWTNASARAAITGCIEDICTFMNNAAPSVSKEPAIESAGLEVAAPSARCVVGEREKRRVYKKSDEYKEYLRYRFSGAASATETSFHWDGKRWRYLYTDFDDTGDFDLLEGAAPVSPAPKRTAEAELARRDKRNREQEWGDGTPQRVDAAVPPARTTEYICEKCGVRVEPHRCGHETAF